MNPSPSIVESESPPSSTVLEVKGLHTHFHLNEGTVRAVDGVDFVLERGKTLCLVGESGCGKSVTAFSILRLLTPPGKIVGGQLLFHDQEGITDIAALPPEGTALRKIRGNRIAMIFQEPMTSMSPVHTVGSQIAEAVQLHQQVTRHEAELRAVAMMGKVGIPDPKRRIGQYPHEMSGGLRQRAMIAMALVCRPDILIADEPTTALDVTIQAEILFLMRELQEELNMAILLITHDLGVVAQMADRVAVMYWGKIVEEAPVEVLFDNPRHPYSCGLMASIPGRAAPKSRLEAIRGSVPDPLTRLAGCPYHPRCSHMIRGQCDVGERPLLMPCGKGQHVACPVVMTETNPPR